MRGGRRSGVATTGGAAWPSPESVAGGWPQPLPKGAFNTCVLARLEVDAVSLRPAVEMATAPPLPRAPLPNCGSRGSKKILLALPALDRCRQGTTGSSYPPSTCTRPKAECNWGANASSTSSLRAARRAGLAGKTPPRSCKLHSARRSCHAIANWRLRPRHNIRPPFH